MSMPERDEEHFVGKIAQKVIVTNEQKILLVQDPRESRDIWELPGGRMNVDEEPRAAVQREFKEEMGVSIVAHEVVHLEQFIQGSEGARAFVIVYRATLAEPQAEFILATDEVSRFAWFSAEEIADLELYPEYERAVNAYFQPV